MRTLLVLFLAMSLASGLSACVNSNKPPPDGVLDPRGEK
jgi:hypothetical protein